MDKKKILFENKYVEIFFYIRGFLCGLVSENDDIHLVLPFIGFTFKQEHNNFIKSYGEFIIGLFVGWTTLIVISHIIL